MKLFKSSLTAFSAAAATLLSPLPSRAETVREFLQQFHANPSRMMERLPSMVDSSGQARPQGFINYGAVEERLPFRLALREVITGMSAAKLATSDPKENDLVEKFVDSDVAVERNLPTLQNQSLTNAAARVKPWADSYWPTYRGQIAYRYADRSGPSSKIWSNNYAEAMANPASAIVATGNTARINMLSPAEKYDFVMGDLSFTLTSYSWNRGKESADRGWGVATWMGICHGWSAAAHMGEPFIGQPVTVLSQTGIPVTFYPQDIKALQSMLWANGAPSSRFLSGRCSVSRPTRNANGRVLDQNCFDTNPATWHLAVANQLGKKQRSFVFDGTYDAEVWNFPIVSAKYRYFNPQTLEETTTFKQAAIPMASYKVDKFREFRSQEAKSVVGIAMDVTYTIEIEPGISRVFDAPAKTVRYIYDLELDGSDNVIGGEWYSNAHPDFIWTFDSTAQAMAFDENQLLNDPWTGNTPVPLNWTPFARKASARGVPLFAFLKKVIATAGPVYQQ